MNRGGGDSILSVYSDARAEYTKQLSIFLVPAYFQFFLDLLERAKQEMTHEPKKVLWQFQTYLNEIHDWNMEKVSQEIHRIHTNSGCDYLEDLLTAVFIAHTKVLTAIRLGQHQKKVEIHIPKVDHFLFKVMCESAKLLWSSSYLFHHGISSIEKQQNYRSIEGILNEGIVQAVRALVPVKSILKDFVHPAAGNKSGGGTEEEESDEEDMGVSLSAPAPLAPAPAPALAALTPLSDLSDPLPPLPPSAPLVAPPLPPLPPPSLPAPPLGPDLPAPTIVLDGKQHVRFGQFNSVFDMDHPSHSDMVYDSKESDTDENSPDLDILDKEGTPLGEEDVDSLEMEGGPLSLEEGEFEVLE